MNANKLLFLVSGILVVFALSLASAEDDTTKGPDTPADPAITTTTAPKDPAAAPTSGIEASPETSAPPTPVPTPAVAPEKPADKPADKAIEKPAKKSKKTNKTRKVKTACDILDNPDGKKVGSLKVGAPLWTDEHSEGWAKVYRKSSVGYAKMDCFE